MMNPRAIRIAGHMALTSLTLYVADVLLRTNNSVAGAMLLILGTLVIHLLRPLIHSSIEPPSMSFRVWLNKSSLPTDFQIGQASLRSHPTPRDTVLDSFSASALISRPSKRW
ncbi:hypothetical protein HDG34_002373 [Paraburkholderia sp. HC6.4b]|uniref:hypothetical protein n=2 Tax=unclassified Paraburkholderia TaxID=2615204 RepID=UPI001608B8DA|nr:hypothetical protein [Paraburkholderia sp. HC6.4b]MBB5408437.1 hypothetical protein [Paraburkholderia sp. HC6.4b]MBB5451542.1 hypothetical protein [Paraburkholderia sp. Kb1A]